MRRDDLCKWFDGKLKLRDFGGDVSNNGLQVEGRDEVRKAVRHELDAQGFSQSNIMGLVACQTAYQAGAEWVDQLIDYLLGNLSLMRETFRTRMPQLHLIEPEGTYLPWVDFSKLGLNTPELERFIVERAKLWLDGGHIFGAGGAGFQRFNIATPRTILQEALDQLENAVRQIS